MRPASWLLPVTLLSSCHGAPAESPPRGAPGDLEVVLENHLGWPYRLETVRVALDGQLVHQSRGEAPVRAQVAALRGLPAGPHTVVLFAKVRYASGAVTDTCWVSVKTSDSFMVEQRAGRMTLDLFARGPSTPFDERVRVHVRREGLTATGEVQSASAPEPACDGDALQRLACRARARVAAARRQKNVIALSCYDAKLRAVEVLQREADRVAVEPGSRDVNSMERRAIADRAATLSSELDACVSSHPAALGDEARGEAPACRGDELLPEGGAGAERTTRAGLR